MLFDLSHVNIALENHGAKKIQGISISQEQKDQLLKGKEITLKGKHDIPIKVKYDVAKADFSIKTQNPELKQDLKIADTNKDMSIEKEVSRQKSKGPKR